MPIDEKVALLHKPGVYPGEVRQVEVIETPFSWVFLTEHHVYKLKKPVRYHGLDLTTLATRRRVACSMPPPASASSAPTKRVNSVCCLPIFTGTRRL